MIYVMGQFGTTSQAVTLSKRNGQNNKKRENTRTRAKDVGKRLELAQTHSEGCAKGKSSMKGSKTSWEGVVGLRTRQGEVAACTLVWVAWSGSWGRAGCRSRGPPGGGSREGRLTSSNLVFTLVR